MNTKNLLEPYLKDNNLLQLSLFNFSRRRLKKTFIEWEDSDGQCSLSCNCEHGVPGSREQDCYTACMRIWIKQGMSSSRIEVSYSDIVRELGGKNPKYSVGKIKESLKRLGGARYEFNQCFVKADKHGNNKVTTQFSLFDSTSLFENHKGASKRDSVSILIFPDIIVENLEARYYQYLDMAWYRSLPEGLPRRLYEFLTKRKYHCDDRNVFTINEEAICRWLPINDQHTTNRRKRLREIALPLIDKGYLLHYVFDTKKKHCVFTYSDAMPPKQDILKNTKGNIVSEMIEVINPKKDQQIVFLEALDWIDSIPYFHKKKREEIAGLPISHVVSVYPAIRKKYQQYKKNGKNLRPSRIYNEFMAFSMPLFDSTNNDDSDSLSALYKSLKKDTNSIRKVVDFAFEKYGFEYVKNNILYANHHAKSSYGSYLSQSIEKNWGNVWADEKALAEKQQQEIAIKAAEEEKKRLEEEEHKKMLKRLLVAKRELFKKQVADTQKMILGILWSKATQKIPEGSIGRGMNIKIEFCKLLLQLFNEENTVYPDEVISDLAFVSDVAKLYKV